jgi:hypothetical protein
MVKRVHIPTRTGRTTSAIRKRKVARPVRITLVGETLQFARAYPKATWMVPPVGVPLYWFDIMMLRKKLLTRVGDDLFVVDGRRFRVIAQDHKVIGVGYTRWLVYEENINLPDRGRP